MYSCKRHPCVSAVKMWSCGLHVSLRYVHCAMPTFKTIFFFSFFGYLSCQFKCFPRQGIETGRTVLPPRHGPCSCRAVAGLSRACSLLLGRSGLGSQGPCGSTGLVQAAAPNYGGSPVRRQSSYARMAASMTGQLLS